MLSVEHLTVRAGTRLLVDDVSFRTEPGRWLMLVGPNGAGKSTIVNAVSQLTPYTGRVLFAGEDVAKMKPAALARRMGVLSQHHFVGYGFTVEEIVRLGRYAWAPAPFSAGNDEDARHIAKALRLTGLEPLRRQSALTLSGGELQRAFLAQLFAQDPQLLILDEPTNHLDLVYQRATFQLLREWLAGGERAVVSVVHDLSLARAWGTDALLLNEGRCVACGPAAEVLTRERLADVYRMDVYDWMREMLAQWE